MALRFSACDSVSSKNMNESGVLAVNEQSECLDIAVEANSSAENTDHYNPSVREVNIPKLGNGSCGFDLSRSKWDPYPWVCYTRDYSSRKSI